MNTIIASVPHHAARPKTALRPGSLRHYSLANLRSNIASWREQARFRWDLKRIAQTNPHLIDDIGLTREQVDDEIAKLPFWQR